MTNQELFNKAAQSVPDRPMDENGKIDKVKTSDREKEIMSECIDSGKFKPANKDIIEAIRRHRARISQPLYNPGPERL